MYQLNTSNWMNSFIFAYGIGGVVIDYGFYRRHRHSYSIHLSRAIYFIVHAILLFSFFYYCLQCNYSAACMHLYWNNPNWHCRYLYTMYYLIIPVSIGYSRSRIKIRFMHQLQGNIVIFNLITVEYLVNLIAWLFVCIHWASWIRVI